MSSVSHSIDLGSRKLSLLLLVSIILLSIAFYRLRVATDPPDVPGYRWAEHERVLVLCHQSDCGCGATPEQWTNMARSHGFDVLILTSQSHSEARLLFNRPDSHLVVYTNFDKAALNRVSSSGNLVALLVKNGRVALHGTGNSMSAFFTNDVLKGK